MYGPVFNYTPGNTMGVGQSSESSSTSPFSKLYSTSKSEDTLDISGQGGEKKKSKSVISAVTDFGKGIVKGAYNAVASLFTVKGMLMVLGTVALVAVAPAVAIPLLVAGGVVMGGTQVAQGLATGDWEKAGEGTFTLGATMLGAKFGPETVKGAGESEYAFVKTAKKDGVTTTSKQSGMFGNTWANIKSVFGGKLGKLDKDGNIMTTADGKLVDGKNIYQLTKEKFSKNKTQDTSSDAGKGAVLSAEADPVESTVTRSSDVAQPMTRQEQVLARIEQRKADEQAAIPSKGTRLMDENGVTHNIKGAELKRIRTQVDQISKDVQEAHANAKDGEEAGYLGSLGTTPEKMAQAQAKAKAKVLSRYDTQLNELTQDLTTNEKQQFRDLIGETDDANKATFEGLVGKARDKAVERLTSFSDVAGQQALRDAEIAGLKDLQQRTRPLTEADTATLKALEEKYPHRSTKSTLQRRELREMKNLQDLQTDSSLSNAQRDRLDHLRAKHHDEGRKLIELRHIDRVKAARTDFKNVKLPDGLRGDWSEAMKKGDDFFKKKMDMEEFESLKALRGNKTYEFNNENLNRYNELETSLKGNLQELEGKRPKIFRADAELSAGIKRLQDLLKPQETVNPTEQELLSMKDRDVRSFQNEPRVEGLPEAPAKPVVDIAEGVSGVKPAPVAPAKEVSFEEFVATQNRSEVGRVEDDFLSYLRKHDNTLKKPSTYSEYYKHSQLDGPIGARKLLEGIDDWDTMEETRRLGGLLKQSSDYNKLDARRQAAIENLDKIEARFDAMDDNKFDSGMHRATLRRMRELRDNKTIIVDDVYTDHYGQITAVLQKRLETLQGTQNLSKNADAQKEIAELQELLKPESKDKKWFSGFNGPHGTGQILSATIAGTLADEEGVVE